MKKKGIEDVKNSKYFSIWDTIPYLCVVVVAVVLMLVFLLPKKQIVSDFYVDYGDSRVMSYDFDEDEYRVEEEFADSVKISATAQGYLVEITTARGYNAFTVDTQNRSVKMTDADCSFSQDCTYMPAIEKAGDSIICVPHQLKIIAGGGISSPVTG